MLCAQYAKEQMVDLEKTLTELESLRLNLAAYLCEEESTFKLDECIKVFQTFCEKFSRAVKVYTTDYTWITSVTDPRDPMIILVPPYEH